LKDGEILRVKASLLKPEFQDAKYRRVKVRGGFGMEKNTRGTCVMVEFLCDGEECRFEGYDLEEDKD